MAKDVCRPSIKRFDKGRDSGWVPVLSVMSLEILLHVMHLRSLAEASSASGLLVSSLPMALALLLDVAGHGVEG